MTVVCGQWTKRVVSWSAQKARVCLSVCVCCFYDVVKTGQSQLEEKTEKSLATSVLRGSFEVKNMQTLLHMMTDMLFVLSWCHDKTCTLTFAFIIVYFLLGYLVKVLPI